MGPDRRARTKVETQINNSTLETLRELYPDAQSDAERFRYCIQTTIGSSNSVQSAEYENLQSQLNTIVTLLEALSDHDKSE